MQLSWEQLHGLPVQTQSGQKLGAIESIEIDAEAHLVIHYVVKPSISLLTLFKKPFLISRSQVVLLNQEKMIVHDSVTSQEPATNKKQTRLASAVAKSDLNVDIS